MLKRFAILFFVFVTHGAWASNFGLNSAYRDPGTSYQVYKNAAKLFGGYYDPLPYKTPMDQAVKFGSANFPDSTAWDSMEVMSQGFMRVRDHRFLVAPDRPDFLRRSSWLFPDDGCYARAAMANRNFSQWSFSVPNKVFAFGDLAVTTDNSPNGQVTWWYHVAPLIQIGTQKYVLDPAISPERPLKLEEWLSRMSHRPHDLEVAICESGTYAPGDDCSRVTDGVEQAAESEQIYFLQWEWERLLDLNRDPEAELGDSPPWLN